jgi:oxygen-independent coproporphyrinogen III oxidase
LYVDESADDAECRDGRSFNGLLGNALAGLYVHIPFCRQRCSYCDFYFVTTRASHASFLAALNREIEHYGHLYGEREPIETVYFGGGTPSRLSIEDWFGIVEQLRTHFDLSDLREFTVEANPDDVDLDYLRELRRLGVTRLSLGVQSFFESDLQAMNRAHDADQAERVIGIAHSAGFADLSIDLIFGLPDQPFEYWGANLEKAVRLGVTHISTYGLTVEPGTPLEKDIKRGLLSVPDDDTVAERYAFTMEYLRERGFEHYEISSFAKPGHRSRHNHAYWNHTNYIGFGPSAHSFWWKGLPAARWSNVRNLARYEALMKQSLPPLDDRESVSIDRLANEYIMLRLRTSDGIDLAVLNDRYGCDLLFEREEAIHSLSTQGYLIQENGSLMLTDAGKHLCNSVTKLLLLDE